MAEFCKAMEVSTSEYGEDEDKSVRILKQLQPRC